MIIGLSIGSGIAYRYLMHAAIGGWNCPLIRISLTNRFREICTVGYCSWDRYVNFSIDTCLFDQYVKRNRYNRLLCLG